MKNKYFFIGDSHVDHIVAGPPKVFSEYSFYKSDEFNQAISFHRKPTMFSFPYVVDRNIKNYIHQIIESDALIFVFGLNDAIEMRENEIKFEIFIPKYINKINEIATNFQIKNVLIMSTTECSDLKNNDNWKHKINEFFSHEELTQRLKKINHLLFEECKKYENIKFLSVFGNFSDSNNILKDEYSLDGIHLNKLGISMLLSEVNKVFDNNNYN